MKRDACYDYDRTVLIQTIRRLESTDTTLGIGLDGGSWFVYDFTGLEPWKKHCGPYSTSEQAIDWINGIRETAA